MAKRAPARNFPPSRFPGGIPDDRPRYSRPGPKGRLGNGQLRRQVAEWLAARPGPHTVGEIAKDLGRSAGAVGNALTTLADRAEAARLAGKPLRYEANSATAAAAAAITPKAPAPPKAAPAAPQAGRLAGTAGRAEPPAASPAPPAAPKAPAPPAKPGPVTRPGGQVYRPRVLAGHGRRRGAAHAARRRRPLPAGRAARHGQDEPGRGGLPRPDHRGRRRRHHGRRLRRRVHPEARRHVRVHLRAADQGDAGRPGPVHRRRHPHLARRSSPSATRRWTGGAR